MRGGGSGVSRQWRRLRPPLLPSSSSSKRKLPSFSISRRISSRSLLKFIPIFIFLALVPPTFFHFRLKHLQQVQLKKCGWLDNPPLVCAHGGDSSNTAPNTRDAYRIAIESGVDCIEIDVSRSSDGELFALHDRDLQRISGNATMKVGYMSKEEVKELNAGFQFKSDFGNQKVPTIQDALTLVSSSVRQVILDAKVGPPSYEKGLAKDILSVVKGTNCKNCLIWAKSDVVGSDVIKLTRDVPVRQVYLWHRFPLDLAVRRHILQVGYIVMKDPSTGVTSELLRMKDAGVVGVYHPLIDEKLVRILHGKGKKVYAWTVDDLESMRRLIFEHVDAIVTGHPSLLQRLMEDMKTECLEEGFPLR